MAAGITVSIIGTAGRGADSAKLSKEIILYLREGKRGHYARFRLSLNQIELVSGRAAWAG